MDLNVYCGKIKSVITVLRVLARETDCKNYKQLIRYYRTLNDLQKLKIELKKKQEIEDRKAKLYLNLFEYNAELLP